MEEGNGGSFAVDLNEDGREEKRVALKDRSIALPAGVSGGQEAGKGRVCVRGTGRNVNTDASGQPPPHGADIMLDLVAAREHHLAARCGISGRCGDHGSLNGFTESVGEDEPTMAELGGGGGKGGGLGAASCPTVRRGPLIRQQHPAGEREEETPDFGHATPENESVGVGAVTDWTGICLPHERPPCPRSRAGTDAEVWRADANMPNGGVDSSACVSGPLRGQNLHTDCEEVRIANGGLHLVNSASDRDMRSDLQPRKDTGSGLGFCARAQSDCGEQLASHSPGEDAPPAAGHPRFPSTPGSSAKFSSPCPSTMSNLNGDSPLSEPHTRDHDGDDDDDEEEDFSDLCLPVRPQSLRTNPNIGVSLSCDATPLSPDPDGGFYFGCEGHEDELRNVLEAGRRQSAPDTLPDLAGQTDSSDPKLMPKRFGIADFFTRSLFSRKSKEPKAASHNAPGWRLFGKPTAREGDPARDSASSPSSKQCEQEEQAKDSAGRRKNLEFEPLSTTALILEDRPANLPAKSVEETQRHKLEYEEMVAGAKRRELKEAQKKKRQMKERHRQEDGISKAMVVWNNEILPHWDVMKGTRRVRELWWQGLPPSVRGRVWSLAIGNELNITPELYEIFLSRAKEKWRSYSETSSVNDSESDGGASLADRESSLDLIKLDISRTFPPLFIFQKGGPYHDLLHSVLGAYTCYRPDIGYVQGMSFIAAVLILNLEEAEAFITFANLLNKPCQMAFFRVDHELMLKYFAAFEVFFEENLPRLFSHFQSNSLTPDLYLIDWIFTLYSKSLPLDVACRVWDVFCRDGEESLFRTGLGILRLYEDVLLQMDFIHIAQFLTRLPDDLQPHTLFSSMANTHMSGKNGRWAQVFTALMKDGVKETDRNGSPALRS